MRGKVVRGCQILGSTLRRGNCAFHDDASSRILIGLVRCVHSAGTYSLLRTIRRTLHRIINTCTVTIIRGGGHSRVVTTHRDDPVTVNVNQNRCFLDSSTTSVVRCARSFICIGSKRVTIVGHGGPLGVIALSGRRNGVSVGGLRVDVSRLRGNNCPRFVLGRVCRRPGAVISYVHNHVGPRANRIGLSNIVSGHEGFLRTHHVVFITYKAS